MQSTFDNILGLPGMQRACLCCGAITRTRHIAACRVSSFTDQSNAPLAHAFENILSLIVQQQNGLPTRHQIAFLCLPCIQWINQHKIHSPIFYFKSYIETLETLDNQCFDRRIIRRICKNLAARSYQRTNYYLTFFTSKQQDLIFKIATEGTQTLSYNIAKYFHTLHGNMLFAPSRRISEFLRDHLVNNDLYGDSDQDDNNITVSESDFNP